MRILLVFITGFLIGRKIGGENGLPKKPRNLHDQNGSDGRGASLVQPLQGLAHAPFERTLTRPEADRYERGWPFKIDI